MINSSLNLWLSNYLIFDYEMILMYVIGYYYNCVYKMLYYGYVLPFIPNYDELLEN